jgi:hypothetical protein
MGQNNTLKISASKALLFCLGLTMSVTGIGQEKKPGDVIWEIVTGSGINSSPEIRRIKYTILYYTLNR